MAQRARRGAVCWELASACRESLSVPQRRGRLVSCSLASSFSSKSCPQPAFCRSPQPQPTVSAQGQAAAGDVPLRCALGLPTGRCRRRCRRACRPLQRLALGIRLSRCLPVQQRHTASSRAGSSGQAPQLRPRAAPAMRCCTAFRRLAHATTTPATPNAPMAAVLRAAAGRCRPAAAPRGQPVAARQNRMRCHSSPRQVRRHGRAASACSAVEPIPRRFCIRSARAALQVRSRSPSS